MSFYSPHGCYAILMHNSLKTEASIALLRSHPTEYILHSSEAVILYKYNWSMSDFHMLQYIVVRYRVGNREDTIT